MPVYADPSELRTGTRLPKGVVAATLPLPGLETRTGGDILITPLERPLKDVRRNVLPVRIMLRQHFDSGAVLVARKSGTDLLNSLADLKEIELRMLEWAGPGACWLVHTGVYAVESGTVTIDGYASRVKPKQVEAALFWWKRRGGHCKHLDSDTRIGAWLNEMLTYARRVMEEPVRCVVHKPAQALVKGDQNWVTTGLAFPLGFGVKKREAIYETLKAEGLQPSVGNAVFRVAFGDKGVPGIGKVLRQRCIEWCGFDEEFPPVKEAKE